MTKFEVKLQKLPKSAKNGQIVPPKTKNSKFSYGYYYSYTLEDTQEKILGSFQPKLMTKFEVKLLKLQK